MVKKTFVLAILLGGASIFAAGKISRAEAAQAGSTAAQQPAQDGQSEKRPAENKQAAAAPPYVEHVEDVKDVPKTLAPDMFDDPATKQAYQVARDDPKLLLQLPCYCPCDRAEIGHKSLLDCFVDTHASGCGICRSEALAAARLRKEGASIEEIRKKLAADYSKGQ